LSPLRVTPFASRRCKLGRQTIGARHDDGARPPGNTPSAGPHPPPRRRPVCAGRLKPPGRRGTGTVQAMIESFTVVEWRISSVKGLASVSHWPPSIVMLTVGGEIGMWVEM